MMRAGIKTREKGEFEMNILSGRGRNVREEYFYELLSIFRSKIGCHENLNTISSVENIGGNMEYRNTGW